MAEFFHNLVPQFFWLEYDQRTGKLFLNTIVCCTLNDLVAERVENKNIHALPTHSH